MNATQQAEEQNQMHATLRAEGQNPMRATQWADGNLVHFVPYGNFFETGRLCNVECYVSVLFCNARRFET